MCIKSLHLIVNLISDNSPGMIAYLKKYSFYQPFISILNSHLERTRIVSMNCIYIIQSITKDSLLSDELIDGIRLLNVLDMTQSTLCSLMSFMTKSVNPKSFPTIVDKFDFKVAKPIYFPQFFPLFATIVALEKEEERNDCLQFLRKSVNDFEETKKAFAFCNHWIFWFIFLGYVEKKNEEWLNSANLVIIANDSVLSNLFNLMLFCDVYGIDSSKNVEKILSESIEKKPSPKLALFVIKYVLFKIELKTKEKLNLDDSIHKFCQEFVLANCPTFSFKYNNEIMNPIDLKMMITATTYLISSGFLFTTQNPQQHQQTSNQSQQLNKLNQKHLLICLLHLQHKH